LEQQKQHQLSFAFCFPTRITSQCGRHKSAWLTLPRGSQRVSACGSTKWQTDLCARVCPLLFRLSLGRLLPLNLRNLCSGRTTRRKLGFLLCRLACRLLLHHLRITLGTLRGRQVLLVAYRRCSRSGGVHGVSTTRPRWRSKSEDTSMRADHLHHGGPIGLCACEVPLFCLF